MELIRQIFGFYKFMFVDLPDPRTAKWLLVAKPYQGLTILALYLMFVLKWGPRFMKNRKPYNLDKVLIVYNIAQVLSCGYFVYIGINEAWGWRYRWLCEPVDYSESEHGLNVAKIVYYYYMMKFIDMADTIFFVLRKKFNQISFLHLYHHVIMIILTWSVITYFPGGHGTLVGMINSVVHCVMYSYYCLTVAVPEMKKSIGLKKFVTQIQIIQFFMTILHTSVVVFRKNCAYPPWTATLVLIGNIFMLVLFLKFYFENYIKKPKQELHKSMNGVKKEELETEQTVASKITSDEDTKDENIFVRSIQNSKSSSVLRNLKR